MIAKNTRKNKWLTYNQDLIMNYPTTMVPCVPDVAAHLEQAVPDGGTAVDARAAAKMAVHWASHAQIAEQSLLARGIVSKGDIEAEVKTMG